MGGYSDELFKTIELLKYVWLDILKCYERDSVYVPQFICGRN